MALVSQASFTIYSIVIFFLPLCGPIGAHHIVYTVWVLSNMLAERNQYQKSSTKWKHNFFNKVDFIVLVLLFIATVLRFVLIDIDGVIDGRLPALDFADWLNQICASSHRSPSAFRLPPSLHCMHSQLPIECAQYPTAKLASLFCDDLLTTCADL